MHPNEDNLKSECFAPGGYIHALERFVQQVQAKFWLGRQNELHHG